MRRRTSSIALAEAIGTAARGLILAGRQGDPAIAPAVASLAELTGFPILAEPTSQLRCGPHDRSLVISAYDQIAKSSAGAARPRPRPALRRDADLEAPARLDRRQRRGQVVVDPAGAWNEPSRTAGLDPASRSAGGSRRVARGALDGSAADRGFAEAWIAADRAVAEALARRLGEDGELTEPGIQQALAAVHDDGDLVFTASSMPIRDQEAFLPSGPSRVLFLSNRGANGIDGTISSAVGAAIASGRPTWVVLGDLALHHDSNGLAAIRHSPVPVRVVVIDNDGGGIFEFLPQAEQVSREEFEALFGTPLGLDAERYAELHGLDFIEASAADDLAELPAGSCLVRVRTDRGSNLALHRELDSLAAAALGEALSGGGASGAVS